MSKKTPMEQQYDSIKKQHTDKILLFRLGDFYEIFNDDAVLAAQILNIALTKRQEKPMCGFPHHAAEQYVYKLVEAGHKVAVCEQVEDANQAKGIVRRDVVKVLTKGTWAENPLLDHSVNSFLAIISVDQQDIVILFADIVTGDIILCSRNSLENALSFLSDELARYMPVETVCMKELSNILSLEEELKIFQENLRFYDRSFFTANDLSHHYFKKNTQIKQYSLAKQLSIFGLFSYLQENHFDKDSVSHLQAPDERVFQNTMFMNDDTMRHLELVCNSQDFSVKGTLFSVLNKCKTMPASRKLRRLIVSPPTILLEIQKMQDKVSYFFHNDNRALIDLLKGIGDLERLTARLMTGKILPRECLSLMETAQNGEKLFTLMNNAKPFEDLLAMIQDGRPLIHKIQKTINPETSNMIDGSVILKGVDKELDSYREILQSGKDFLIKLQTEERIKTGITSLKIAYNKIYGYYIEVSKAAKNIPNEYIRKQSLVNAERYTIPELDEFEQKIQKAEANVIQLERTLYDNLVNELQEFYQILLPLTNFITEIDLRLSLALVAQEKRYEKPTLTENFNWDIKEGRHPIVENLLTKDSFVSNDTCISLKERILVVTGPNMAGKSTYLRQNALFAVMAQIGAYLPAKEAKISIVDQIFTRIGASDDLSSGRSTFFVEMQEASLIVNQMTEKSLVIMDELGRGTSTLDGLSLAWAILEHLLFHPNKKGKVFFSTHYHELTELAKFDGIKNLCMAIKDNKGKPIFLRKVVEGKSSKSYGIHVAELAGMDSNIISRAMDILTQIEKGIFFKQTKEKESYLFSRDDDPLKEMKDNLYSQIRKIKPDSLSPLDALRILYELKNISKQ